MTGDVQVAVHPGPDALAAAVAARLITALVDVQARGRVPRVVLTGGGVGIQLLRDVAASPARDAVDWGSVDVFWGDERFVGADDGDRNEKQAHEALLDHVPLDPARVHPMPAASADGGTREEAEEAARDHAAVLAGLAGPGEDGIPAFDVTLVGMGEEGHTLSVFPDSPAVHEQAATVVPVFDCPKPPPTRISLTLAAARRSREVWVVAAGTAKAPAVAGALTGTPETELPVAGARGTERTRWLLDADAAARLPEGVRPARS
ncbi:6-phosphogluconolactonase [Pseudonocardia sp. HH130630-07]|uniref:6-phosphogluconolactonase n=1 Tax=Pseudonocardia sp. HH130630-07 TaxID=1690815 RepID=UPI000814E8AC|nr:6-phosphogluconolactonase [Pseudonocardia sp. HH130630-07]ANY08981.1 6-phosphogluconolactonase [Pseudonocardia sp. HH130630-07]